MVKTFFEFTLFLSKSAPNDSILYCFYRVEILAFVLILLFTSETYVGPCQPLKVVHYFLHHSSTIGPKYASGFCT